MTLSNIPMERGDSLAGTNRSHSTERSISDR